MKRTLLAMALLVTSVFGVTGCGSDDDGEAPVESRIKNSTGDPAPLNYSSLPGACADNIGAWAPAYEEDDQEEDDQEEDVNKRCSAISADMLYGAEDTDTDTDDDKLSALDDRLSDLNDDINNDSKDDDFRGRDDLLDIASLLPGDSDGPWIQVNPDGKGGIEDKNFLSSGHHLGVDTVGSSLRDANRQIRSEPPNPQVQVSPWLQGTISPDPLRRPLDPIDDD